MSDDDDREDDLSTPVTPEAAREQAAEAGGFLASRFYQVGDEVLELPHPEFFDDDLQAGYDALKFESESWDYEEVERSNPLTGEVVIHPETGKPVKDRRIIQPHRKTVDGKTELVENFNVRFCKILWGAGGYAKFKKAGGRANQVMVDLQYMQRRYKERLSADPKSKGSGVADPPVSDEDRG